jgi:hypothetical protein
MIASEVNNTRLPLIVIKELQLYGDEGRMFLERYLLTRFYSV